MTRITYFIPGRPVPFARAGSKGYRRYTPEPQASYVETVAGICWERMRHGGVQIFTGPVKVILEIVFEARRKKDLGHWKPTKADLDNLVKIQLDAVSGLAFKDDALICEILATKRWGDRNGVTVTIEELV